MYLKQRKKYLLFSTGIIVLFFLFLFVNKYNKYIKYARYYVFPIETLIDTDNQLYVDTDTLNRIDAGYGDWLVHPCVRYIPEGLGGHKWWMAVTPYPEGNNKYEQPILYYGDGDGSIPPQEWVFFGMIQDMPQEGYNADPNMYYDENDSLLYIIWKETRTPNTSIDYNSNAIMYRTFDGHSFSPVKKLFDNSSDKEVLLTAPSLIRVKDSLYCYATKFEHERVSGSLLPRGKCGIAVWKNNNISLDSVSFQYVGSNMPIYPEDFDYWHTEFVYDKGCNYYFSVVTNEEGFDALVGMSKDGTNYQYLDKPLISFRGKGHPRNLYKASIVIVEDNIYFFYPKRSKESRTVHIYYARLNKEYLCRLFNNK